MLTDTIAAISTPLGVGGISIIRISGDKAFNIIKKIFFINNENTYNIEHGTIKYGKIINPQTLTIEDEVLTSFFKAPNSYTTEDVCEINCHGGRVITKKILDIVLVLGARIASPGEFTKRAFINGRIDLVQAEAIIELITSKTDKMNTQAQKQLEGQLSFDLKEIKEKILEIITNIEVGNDYPEYEFEEISKEKILKTLEEAEQKTLKLINSFENGKIIKDGIKIAIIGRPNTGKSSLLNRILKENRAIVTEIEGTTRDVIEEEISIRGIKIILSDTAGIRQTDDIVEKIGIEKSIEKLKESDLIVLIIDGSKSINMEDFKIILESKKNIIILLNKIDLLNNKEIVLARKQIEEIIKLNNNNLNIEIIETSIIDNIGIEDFEKKIVEMFELEKISADDSITVTNTRHKQLIIESLNQLREAIDATKNNMPIDIISVNLKQAVKNLYEITGENVTEEVIKEIFSRFCLGK